MNDDVVAAVLRTTDGFNLVIEIVVGHRTKLLAQGFSETAAEQCVVQMHQLMMAKALMGT